METRAEIADTLRLIERLARSLANAAVDEDSLPTAIWLTWHLSKQLQEAERRLMQLLSEQYDDLRELADKRD